MAIEMEFEVDERLSPDQAALILCTCGFTEFENDTRGFTAFHPETRLNAYFAIDMRAREVLAEGMVPSVWKRHYCMTFRYAKANLEACHAVTMDYARMLAVESPAYFVLSFQFEGVYAIRDASGFREVTDPASTMQFPAV